MMSTDALIRDLADGLAPIRRRRVSREAALVIGLAAAELTLIVGAGAMRPDMARMILSPVMIWKIGSLALLAGVACTVAMRSFAPPAAPPRGLMLTAGLAALATIGAFVVTSGVERSRSVLDRLAPLHGMLCTTAIIVLALPIMAALAVLMRRGAPVRPRRSALASGVAAAACGALIFTACCPMNDPLYILVWYSLAVAVVALAARILLPRQVRL